MPCCVGGRGNTCLISADCRSICKSCLRGPVCLRATGGRQEAHIQVLVFGLEGVKGKGARCVSTHFHRIVRIVAAFVNEDGDRLIGLSALAHHPDDITWWIILLVCPQRGVRKEL